MILHELREKYENDVDLMIHCGDSELRAVDPAIKGYSTVKGNCDYDEKFSNELLLDVKGNKIFVTHGHLFQIKSSLSKVSHCAKELEADFVFFGHSHLLKAEMIDGTLFLNPGSISLPRGGNEKTYALVEKDEHVCTVRFYNEKHQELTGLGSVYSQ